VNNIDPTLQHPFRAAFGRARKAAARASTVLSVFHSYTAAEPHKIKGSEAIVKSAGRAFRKIAFCSSLESRSFSPFGSH
jgi:hypothetical protein